GCPVERSSTRSLPEESIAGLCSAGQPRAAVSTWLCFYFSQLELAGGGATGVAGLHQYGGIRQGGFIDFDLHLGVAGGIGDHLGVEGCSVGAGEADREACSGNAG